MPASASREDLAIEQRIAACERRLEELQTRVVGLEERRGQPRTRGERHWAFWVIFLAGLAVAWQIVGLFR
jgi:hypothetical protein